MPRRPAFDARLSVRASAAELRALRALAARHGRSLSRYLVERGLAGGAALGPERRLAHEQAMVQLRTARAALDRIARRLDGGRAVPAGDLAGALGAVTAAAEAIEQALAR